MYDLYSFPCSLLSTVCTLQVFWAFRSTFVCFARILYGKYSLPISLPVEVLLACSWISCSVLWSTSVATVSCKGFSMMYFLGVLFVMQYLIASYRLNNKVKENFLYPLYFPPPIGNMPTLIRYIGTILYFNPWPQQILCWDSFPWMPIPHSSHYCGQYTQYERPRFPSVLKPRCDIIGEHPFYYLQFCRKDLFCIRWLRRSWFFIYQ